MPPDEVEKLKRQIAALQTQFDQLKKSIEERNKREDAERQARNIQISELKESIDSRIDGLKGTIEKRIELEDKVQSAQTNTLKAYFGGEFGKLKAELTGVITNITSLFQQHCVDQMNSEADHKKELSVVHSRVDKLLELEAQAKPDFYQAPTKRLDKAEMAIAANSADAAGSKESSKIGWALALLGITVLVSIMLQAAQMYMNFKH